MTDNKGKKRRNGEGLEGVKGDHSTRAGYSTQWKKSERKKARRAIRVSLKRKENKGEKGGNIKDDKGGRVRRAREGIRCVRTTRISKSNAKEQCIEGK